MFVAYNFHTVSYNKTLVIKNRQKK